MRWSEGVDVPVPVPVRLGEGEGVYLPFFAFDDDGGGCDGEDEDVVEGAALATGL